MVADQIAHQFPESLLLRVVEVVLATEEDDLVLQQRGTDVGDGLGGQVTAQAHTVDDGADLAGQFGGSEHGNPFDRSDCSQLTTVHGR